MVDFKFIFDFGSPKTYLVYKLLPTKVLMLISYSLACLVTSTTRTSLRR